MQNWCSLNGCSMLLFAASAYPCLVKTLKELFAGPRGGRPSDAAGGESDDSGGGVQEFIMSWNRRIAASIEFFELMQAEGFLCHHHGACVYSFVLDKTIADDFAQASPASSSTPEGTADSC